RERVDGLLHREAADVMHEVCEEVGRVTGAVEHLDVRARIAGTGQRERCAQDLDRGGVVDRTVRRADVPGEIGGQQPVGERVRRVRAGAGGRVRERFPAVRTAYQQEPVGGLDRDEG